MKRLGALLAVAAILLAIQGCSRPKAGGTVQIKGSDTMVNLAQAWAEAYAKDHPDANITVTGGGSGTGIAALINGDTSIATASREMKPEELDQARSKGMNPQQFTVARDGLSVIVNPANPVSKLTIAQLSDIYTGKVGNWKQVGGADEKIVVLSRDKSSGTHVFFLEHVVRKGNAKGPEEYAAPVLMLPSSQGIADEVAGNKAAIGYVGMGYVNKLKHKPVAVAKDAKSPYVEPTEQNVLNGTYPVARPLYFYTPNAPTGAEKDFIDFVLSPAGQKIVEQQDFVPVNSYARTSIGLGYLLGELTQLKTEYTFNDASGGDSKPSLNQWALGVASKF
ncbi:MAG: phosphate ABC transporter substrate-binding protein [Armatimonadetes bacterium]|nr:phosphate ABC transporter substrate-binding protein [Armatimonadota bacterium]